MSEPCFITVDNTIQLFKIFIYWAKVLMKVNSTIDNVKTKSGSTLSEGLANSTAFWNRWTLGLDFGLGNAGLWTDISGFD